MANKFLETLHPSLAEGPPPIITGSGPLDSGQAILSQLYGGDLEAVGQSVKDTAALSPQERKKLSTRLGVAGTWVGRLIDIAANPLVIVGAILTMKYKLPLAKDLLQAGSEAREGFIKSLVPLFDKIKSPMELFKGTPVWQWMLEISGRKAEMIAKLRDDLVQPAIEQYVKASGRTPDEDVWRRIFGSLDATGDVTKNESWAVLEEWSAKNLPTELARRVTAAIRKPGGPLKPIVLTDAESKLRDSLKKLYETGYQTLYSDPDALEDVLEHMAAATGYKALAVRKGLKEFPKIADYVPRYVDLDHLERQDIIAAATSDWMSRMAGKRGDALRALRSTEHIYGQRMATAPGKVVSDTSKPRHWALMADPKDLKALGADDDLIAAVEAYTNTALTKPRYYRLGDPENISRYVTDVSNVYGWAIRPTHETKGYGRQLVEFLVKARQNKWDRTKTDLLQNLYVPLSLGRMTDRQLKYATIWNHTKAGMRGWLDSDVAKKYIPKNIRQTVDEWLVSDSSTYPAVGQSISDWLHKSALGLNFSSALINLFQPISTLIPTIGIRDTMHGYSKWFGGLQTFNDELVRNGYTSVEKAIAKAWPEFAKMHVEADPLAREYLENVFSQVRKSGIASKWAAVKSPVDKVLMAPFAFSELTNRVTAFYGSLRKGLRELPGTKVFDPVNSVYKTVAASGAELEDAAIRFARDNVYRTQYGGSYLHKPSGLADWWSPWTQFTTFPLRTAGFVGSTMLKNPGVAGRGLLGAGLLWGGGRELLNRDYSRSLLFGGLPAPSEGTPFSPLPLVPPALQLIGAAAMVPSDSGDSLRRALPLLVPGGIGLARGVGFVPGGAPVSRAIGRQYADYQHPAPDGRVAVYTADKSLIGYFKPQELVSRAIGISRGSSQVEAEIDKFLLANRKRIRQLNLDFTQSIVDNDPESSINIIETFNRAYPGLSPYPMTQQDIRSLHFRQNISRIERITETLPTDVRGQFMQAVSAGLGNQFEGLLGFTATPPMQGTVNIRDPYRMTALSDVRQQVSTSLKDMKLSDKLRAAGIDRGRESADSASQGFHGSQPFSGF